MNIRGSKQNFSVQLLQMFDAVLIWLAFVAAARLRGPIRDLLGMTDGDSGGFHGMFLVVFMAVLFTPIVLERFGHYDRPLSKRGTEKVAILVRGIFLMVFVVGAVLVFSKLAGTRRLVLGIGFLLSFLFLWIRIVVSSKILRSRAAAEGALEKVVIAGSPRETREFEDGLGSDFSEAWDVVGHFDLESRTVDDLNQLLKNESVQRVVFLAKHTEFEKVSRAVETCEVQGVEAWIGASFMQTQVARPSFDSIGGQPMLVFRSTPELSWQLFAKKVVDIVGALLILVLTSPLWIAAIIGIRVSSPGAPVIFMQQRSGLYGKPFRIFKFRTMVANAEKLLDQVKEDHGNEVDGPAFKLKSDPRIFRFGHFLRKFSIDELPQVINVLRGEMSLVGPRPLPLHEIEAIAKSAHRRRLSMKPGITCIWQISGRSDITDFDEWVKLDVEYIDRWSIWEDLRILFKTIPAVLFSKGAR